MEPDPTTERRANLIGSAWMVLAMACFAIEDVLIKIVSASVPTGQILMLFGLGGALLFSYSAKRSGANLWAPAAHSKPMLCRAAFEVFGRLFYALAVILTPLSSTTAILQATSIVVVAGAALFFGEKVGVRRWIAIIVGLIGVLIIIQPGASSFNALSVLAVLGMLGLAGRDLATRASPASLETAVLGFYGFVAVILAGLIYHLWEAKSIVMPSVNVSLYLLSSILVGVVAYIGIIKAMRTGEVSAVVPFRYSRLLFGVTLGVVLFGESLEWTTLLGCALIVSSGLFLLFRGNTKWS
ncbi:MAG: drug/metabolite transporter (DMT)-like permease [Gammaproteobacteria bacterium]|jgi:drug/metabolite transporter (DMT)-like permease